MPADNRFEALAEFAAVARRLSFSAAAQDLAIDRSVLSRRIARLEERLGVRLLQRTTRRLTSPSLAHRGHPCDSNFCSPF